MTANLYTCQRLSSGDQDVVSLSEGLGYGGGATPALVERFDFEILDTSFAALAWRFEIHVNGAFQAGVAGPGWATATFDNELYIGNSQDNATVSLGGGAPYTEAGFFFGAQVIFAFRVKLTGWAGVKWKGGWHGHFESIWKTIADVSQQTQVDFLQILVFAVEYLVNRNKGGPLAEIVNKLKPAQAHPNANWRLIDSTILPLKAITQAKTNLLPQLAVRLDVSEFIPAVRAFNESLARLGSYVQFGPTFGIGFPIHIQVEGVVVDNAAFRVTDTHTSNAKRFFDCTQNNLVSGRAPATIATAGYRPTTVGFRYKWNWGIDLSVGVYCEIDVFYVLSVAPEYHFGLLSLLGLDTNIQNNIRGNLTNRNFAYQRQIAERDLPQPFEVVFEDPVGARA